MCLSLLLERHAGRVGRTGRAAPGHRTWRRAERQRSGATNVTIQSRCPLRVVEHVLLATDGTTYSGIQDALAKRPITLDCLAL